MTGGDRQVEQEGQQPQITKKEKEDVGVSEGLAAALWFKRREEMDGPELFEQLKRVAQERNRKAMRTEGKKTRLVVTDLVGRINQLRDKYIAEDPSFAITPAGGVGWERSLYIHSHPHTLTYPLESIYQSLNRIGLQRKTVEEKTGIKTGLLAIPRFNRAGEVAEVDFCVCGQTGSRK